MPPTNRLTTHPAFPALAAAIAALLVFAITLHGTFVYDDLFIITIDPRISHPALWSQFWTKGYFVNGIDNLYRPLTSMSYALQWQLVGNHPFTYHLVNWLLHAAVAAAVAEFTRRCTNQPTALIAGLLFAVHPVHVEAVAQIVGRAELLAALAVIGALVLFAHRPLTGPRVAAIVACQILAILSKEQGVLLPALLLLFALLLWRKPTDPPPTDSERYQFQWLTVAITFTAAAYFLFREHFLRFEWDRTFLDWGTQPMINSTGADRLLMPLVLLGHYTMLLIYPAHLSIDYGANVIGSTVNHDDPYLRLGLLALATWIIAVIRAALRKNRFALFCLLSFALVYGMIGNILTLIGVNLAERLMYLPSAFLLPAIAILLARLPRRAATAVVTILVLAGAARTVAYARLWNDRLELYTAAVTNEPRSAEVYRLLTQEFMERHDLPHAQQTIERATALFPNYAPIWEQRALIERDEKRYDAAQQSLRRAFVLAPSMQIGQMQQDIAQLQAATRPATTTHTNHK